MDGEESDGFSAVGSEPGHFSVDERWRVSTGGNVRDPKVPTQIDLMWPTIQALAEIGGSASIQEISSQMPSGMPGLRFATFARNLSCKPWRSGGRR